jgi:4-hydroxy-3-methylbut-2-en-1-yl diphosphate reductase
VIAPKSDLVLVIGAPNSSNSLRLVEVAERFGTPSKLIQRADDIDFAWFDNVRTLGLTAGASAPEILVRQFIEKLSTRFTISEEQITVAEEDIVFKLPRALQDADTAAA